MPSSYANTAPVIYDYEKVFLQHTKPTMFKALQKNLRQFSKASHSTFTVDDYDPRGSRLANAVEPFIPSHSHLFNDERMDSIRKAPDVEGACWGEELADEMLARVLDTSITITTRLLRQVKDVSHRLKSTSAGLITLTDGSHDFGDYSSKIKSWIVSNQQLDDFCSKLEVTNGAKYKETFSCGEVRIVAYGTHTFIGLPPSHIENNASFSNSRAKSSIVGLVPDAIAVIPTNYFEPRLRDGWEVSNRDFIAEVSCEIAILGFRWKGGNLPFTIKTATMENRYARIVSNDKLAGIVIEYT